MSACKDDGEAECVLFLRDKEGGGWKEEEEEVGGGDEDE